MQLDDKGMIIILNGVPRSGKSSIAHEIQQTFEGNWVNLGVDNFMKMLPEHLLPGIGLRPGGEKPELESEIKKMYQALFKMIKELSNTGYHVVVDVGIHDNYSNDLNILQDCASILQNNLVWFIGVKCPIDEIMIRRQKTWGIGYQSDGSIPRPVQLWQEDVHHHKLYDLTVNTFEHDVEQSAKLIRQHINSNQVPSAFDSLNLK